MTLSGVEACTSHHQVKYLRQRKNEIISRNHCVCDHVPKMSESEVNNSLMRYKAGSYLVAAKGLLKMHE